MSSDFLPDSYVIFDLETTGFSRIYDSIINIAALDIEDGTVVQEFNTFVKPYKPIPKRITELTGITNEMVADSPAIWDALRMFLNVATPGKVVIGHNVSFDCSFIESKSKRFLGIPFKNTKVDTLCLAREYFPGLQSYKLTSLTQYFGINHENAHTAIADCYATKDLYDIIKKKATSDLPSEQNEMVQLSFA